MGDSPEGLQPGGQCHRLIIVDAISLCKTLRNIADLIAYDFASIIPLAFANELSPKSTLASRDIRPQDKHKDFQFLQAADFILSASNPILPFRGRHCFRPQWIIVDVHFRLQYTICDSSKDLRDRSVVR